MATLAVVGASLSPYYMKELNSAFFALQCIMVPALLTVLVMWIYLFLKRFTFAGAVCAGTYLQDADYDKNSDVEKDYVVDMGLFIKFIAIWQLILVVLLVTIFVCVILLQI